MEELFEFDGQEYTLTEVQEAAKAKSLSVDDYTKQYNISRKPGKTTPPKEDNQGAPAEVNAAPEIQPTVTESPSVDISLELPNQPQTGTSAQTEFIPEQTSEEELTDIENEYIKVGEINIEKENRSKKNSKLFRFKKGKFTINERDEYLNWKEGKGLFAESEELNIDEINEKSQAKRTAFLADLPSYKRQELYFKKNKIYEEEAKKFNIQLSRFNVDQEEIQKEIDLFNSNNNYSKNDFLKLKDKIEKLKSKHQDLQLLSKNLNDKNTLQILDDFKRDYNKISKLENAFETLAIDLAMGPMAVLDMLKSEEGKKKSYTNDLIDYRASLAEEAGQKLAKPIEVSAISDWDTFGTWAADGLINFIPSGLMASTGAAAMPLFFLSGFGSKMSDFALGKRNAVKNIPDLEAAIKQEKDPKAKNKLQDQLDLERNFLTVGDATRVLTAAAYGTAEFVFEIPTIRAVRDISNVGDLIAKNGFKKAIAKSLAAYPAGVGMESASEGLTTLTQNIADIHIFGDKTKSYLDGVDEASAQGALIGNGFKSINTGMIAQAAIRDVIATKSDKAAIKQRVDKINSLTAQLTNKNLTKEEKAAIQKEINNVTKDLKDDQDISAARFLRLTPQQQQEVFEYDRLSRKEIERWNQIASSENIDESTKDELRKEIVDKINKHQSEKQNLLNSSDGRLKPYKKIKGDNEVRTGDEARNVLIVEKELALVEQHNKTTKAFDKIEFDELDPGTEAAWDEESKIIIINTAVLGSNPHVVLHEYTHAVIAKEGFDQKDFDSIKEEVLNEFKIKKDNGEFTDEQYNKAVAKYNLYKNSKDQSEELLTAIGEQIASNQVRKSDESFLSNLAYKIKQAIGSIVGKEEANNFRMDSAQDAFNFINQLTKSVYSKRKLNVATGGDPEKVQEGKKESKLLGADIQKIYDEKGKDGAFDIIEAYKPLTTKLTNKYKDVPGFDFELLQSEIEIGKRGLLDLINAYEPSKGATLNTYIQGQLANRSIEAANRILDTEFKLDVTEAKGVTDTVAAEETIEAAEQAEFADEIKSLRKEIGLPEELVSTVKDAVVKTFGTKLPNPQDPKFRLELQKRFRTELKKPIAKFVGKQADYESFLRDNFQSIYNKLPQSLINRRFKDFQEPVLDKNGKHVREKTAEGNKVYTKKKISKAEFIKYFLGSDVGRSTQGTRKTAIVEAVAEEIAFDATMEVLNDPAVIQKYQDIAGITGEVLPENFKSIIAKQVDRAENFKFSKSIASDAKAEYNLESQELGRILDKTNLDKLSDKYSLISDAIIYEADPNNIKFSLTTKADGKWEQNALNPLDESAKLYKFKVGEVDYEINTFSDRYAFNYDIFESTMGIPDEFVANDPKSWAMAFADALDGSTDLTGVATQGLTNQFKVFGTVANATIDLIKKEKLNSITFSGKEKSRKRLYRSLSDKFAKELGWEAYDFEAQLASGAETVFIVYNPKAFPTTTSVKFSLSAKEKNAVNKIINTLQKDLSKNIESENVNFADDLNLFIFNKFNEEVEKDLNLDKILENVIKATNNFITDKTGKNLISKAVLNTDGKLTRNYFLKVKQAAGIALKKEIAELGYESSEKLLDSRLKNASEIERPKIILNWFINESKAITTFSGLPSITKIQDIYDKVIVKLLEKYNIEGFKIDKNPKGAGKKLFSNNKPIDRYKSTTDIKRNFALYILQINKEAKDAKEYVLGILDYYKNNNLINEGKAHIKLLANDQIGALRKIAKAGMYVENLPTKETTLEHEIPVLEITLAINNFLDGKISRKQLEKEFDNAQVNLVTKKVDKALTAANLKSSGKNRMQNDLVKQAVKKDIDGGIKYKNIESVYNGKKFSKSLNKEFNTILEQSSGIKATKKFSPVEARIAGKGKGKLKLFIPYSADDFVGLLYTTLSGGKAGDQQMDWYRENLLRPFSRGIQQYEAAKQNALREWQILKKEAKKSVPGGLDKKNASGLTNQEAVRLYIWKQQGMEIPGTKGSAAFVNENLKAVRKNPELKAFAERLMALNPEGYPAPSENWDSGDITTDLVSYIDGVKRSEFLTEFKNNADKIFSDSNKEKLRALYGDNFIESLEDMLHRMKTGTNRRFGASKIERQFMDWTNNSVGAIMFFNARSAVLQTLSAVNFINFTDNNPINAAKAFGNFPQYVNDFSTLFNSDFLKQRRTGLQTDVNADEIARAAKGAKNKARAMLSAILKFGFTPTQIADSFAIASGGATFYRNRINKYKKEGLSQQEAEAKAFTDFQEIAEETQQSARPDRISLQQASSLGRLVLAFGNTPMQYARLTKKATLDLINGRGDWKTNMSKIMYYSVIQNIIFSALQQGLFALLFDDEDDDKEKSRLFRIGNSSFDTLLRGTGVYGAAAATVKNMILKIIEESKKSRPDYTKVAIEATAISPPINSKLRKLISAGKTFTYKQSKEKVFTEGFSLENPAFLAGGQVISAATNLPADRVVLKADHLYTAMQPETELWQSIALALGWSEWDLNMIQNQTKKESNLKIKPFKTKGLKIKKFKE